MPTIEEEGLLPTSLPLGLALLLVACELALPSRNAKSTTKDTRRIRTMQPRRARGTLRGAPGRVPSGHVRRVVWHATLRRENVPLVKGVAGER